ncbi:class I SAM-dependent DNA methyltransferase [Metallibacterium scheffleri]|uniref:site-specific DNA-methyltransferase (adenine-specific) n=1 Tax=Metallibacterium scheffleri TaxID=993689 RepID=A0A4S3KMJ2_9GAMM|nr:DNA methyltransferase [Metallibacterium scheffleri]THD10145.1 SAM-dependent methyltransferase [Metallibacterium scheffleri]
MNDHAGAIDQFIDRWQRASGRERANYQLFLGELAQLLDVPRPEPALDDDRDNAYVYERRVVFRHGDGTESYGYIDLYRRGSFVLEAKDVRETGERRYDDRMLRARSQAEGYARALPADEGRPPLLLVVDVGRVIEIYSEFSRSGATYTPFPDPRSHRIRLEDLRDAAIRERLRKVWLDPLTLDPARQSARVTREIASHLALLARELEQAGHRPEAVAGFLTRCLFTMFAEDVALIPPRSFRDLLEALRDQPMQFVPMVGELWRAMDTGAFSVAIRAELLRFNGKLFKQPEVLALERAQIERLIEAARADWRLVEPAIFGTLLERALEPEQRHALGAHYTPRTYVERLVLPTVIEPLREDWKTTQAAALTLIAEGNIDGALAEIKRFHHALCEVRVLDPACGSGNFLYVTLEHLKRLEGEVLNAFDELDPQRQHGGLRQAGLALDATRADPFGGETVDPHQLLGLEINPRAAAIAELVLWIGYLQWHFRTRGDVMPPPPVLKDFRNIEHRDAVLAYDRVEYVTDEHGRPLTRWDGHTTKLSPVTGLPVPDDTARVPLERYVSPRKAAWPAADFVVGNPPFLGKGERMRLALGDGYVEALRAAWPVVPESADFVMYWWHPAADLSRAGALRRFGLITTNSLRQIFNRRLVERAMRAQPALSLVFAIPDHPWVDSVDGAAVRIAMTVGTAGTHEGRLLTVTSERELGSDEIAVDLASRCGVIHADLTVGANVASAGPLRANEGITSMGVMLAGSGFIVSREEARCLGLGRIPGLEQHIREYRNGRDLTQTPRDALVIDLYGLDAGRVRSRYPEIYQWILRRVKPERDANRDTGFREQWWLFGRPRPTLRAITNGLSRYVVTVETSKHHFFLFISADVLADHRLICFGEQDPAFLGVLSSNAHRAWALAAGGTLEDRPVYNKTRCFETFPFPTASDAQKQRLRELGEQLDAHRKRQLAAHPDLTLTGMYNVLDKLRAGETLTAKERTIHEQGLVSVLKQIHDEIDLAALDTYGWSDLAPLQQIVNGTAHGDDADVSATAAEVRAREVARRTEAARALDEILLERLVALNAERAAEEQRGLVRWLRPEFQKPEAAAPQQVEIETGAEGEIVTPVAVAKKQQWPRELTDQVKAVADALSATRVPLTEAELAALFTARGRWRERLPRILDMLVAIGRVRRETDRYGAV